MSKPRPKTIAKHTVKCIDYAFDNGNPVEKKAPQAICRLQIVAGPRTGDTVMYYGSFHEACQEYTAAALRALGMTNDDPTAPVGLGSRKATAVERENLYPGAKNKSRIDFIDAIEPAKIKVNNPVSDKQAAQVASKFKALFKAKPALAMDPSVAAPETVEPVTAADSQPTETEVSPFG
jgi:hypothetical protein